jgi:hypothetical protein
MTKSTAQIMLETANSFVANCDTDTLNWVRNHPELNVPDIDADEALYTHEGFDHTNELFDETDLVMNEQLWSVYCSALDTEFFKQHNIVVKFS